MPASSDLPLGCDVGYPQRIVDWQGAKRDGVRYAWIRWGQAEWTDPYIYGNWNGARQSRILRGAYFVWDETRGGGADTHLETMQGIYATYDGELPVAVDMEKGDVTWNELHEFLLGLEGWTGRRPIIYTGSWYMARVAPLPAWLAEYEFWLTGYNDEGPSLWGPLAELNPVVVCWQQTSSWVVDWVDIGGDGGSVDRDYWWTGALGLWRTVMADKVIKVADLMALIEQMAFECPGTGPTPPPATPAFTLEYPLPTPISQWRMTQEFGINPQWYASIGGHDGIDYGVPVGTPILASHDGIVTVSGYRPGMTQDPYGDHVRIEQIALDPFGQQRKFTTLYAHLSRLDVAIGDHLAAGQQVGLSGGVGSRAGNSTGPHLHFGVKCEGAKGRGETFLEADFVSPWLWLKSLPTAVLEKRQTISNLNVRNLPSTSGSIIRKTMATGVRFNVYEIRNGWGALDISRTAWSSLSAAYSKKV